MFGADFFQRKNIFWKPTCLRPIFLYDLGRERPLRSRDWPHHPPTSARPSQHNGKGRGEERRGWFRVQRIRTKVAKKPRCFPSLLFYPLSDQRQQMASVECPFHYCASVGRGRRRGRDSTNIVATSFSDAATEGRLILGRAEKAINCSTFGGNPYRAST